MILDRLEFLKAIKFLKHSISDNSESGPNNCLHIRVEQDRAILTSFDGNSTAKKAVLLRPITTEELAKEDKHFGVASFLIPKSTLLGFETLMEKHKGKAKELAKNDASFLYVSVSVETLESFGIEMTNKQPACKYTDIEHLFQVKKQAIPEIGVIPSDFSEVIAGFDKSKKIKMTMTGTEGAIHFFQKSTEFEAICLPVSLNEPDEKEKGKDAGKE